MSPVLKAPPRRRADILSESGSLNQGKASSVSYVVSKSHPIKNPPFKGRVFFRSTDDEPKPTAVIHHEAIKLRGR